MAKREGSSNGTTTGEVPENGHEPEVKDLGCKEENGHEPEVKDLGYKEIDGRTNPIEDLDSGAFSSLGTYSIMSFYSGFCM